MIEIRSGDPINRIIERLQELFKTGIIKLYSQEMPVRFRRSWITTLLCVMLFHYGMSQDLDVGLSGGGSYYLGDLNPGMHFKNTGISFGALVRYNIDTRWAVKIAGMYGKVKGSAASGSFLPERGLDFSSAVTDFSAVAEFNFIPYFTGSTRSTISPYIFTGFSFFIFDPLSQGKKLREFGTEGQNIGYEGRKPYNGYSFSIPFGLGVKFSVAKNLGLQVYWEMHKTFTDYLDDVSTTYYLIREGTPGNYAYYYYVMDPLNENHQIKVLLNDPDAAELYNLSDPSSSGDPVTEHRPGMQRGNPANNDWFGFFGVSLTYKFSLLSSKKCRDLDHK